MMSGGVRESLLSGLECEKHATIVLDHARVRMWVIHGVLWSVCFPAAGATGRPETCRGSGVDSWGWLPAAMGSLL